MASKHVSRSVMEGPLSKWTNVMNGWQYRWFVLDQSAGLLSYYTSKDKMKRGSRRGCFRLKQAIIGIDDEDDSTFTIRIDSRTYHFQAQDAEERQQWVHALESCLRHLHHPSPHPVDLVLPVVRRGASLDQRLAESEGYYQLVRDHISTVSQHLNSTEEAAQIRETAKTMLEALRQCIDLIKDSQLDNSLTPSPAPSTECLTPQTVSTPSVTVTEEKVAVVPATVKRESSGSSSDSSESESSSDESDVYLSAEELDLSLISSGPSPLSPSVSVPPPEDGDPSDVEEEVEMEEEDDTSEGVAQNKSVILHMLSQVRVGMDLTKITLPTFILEKRSLLEMYAQFFAHPDLFAAIPDYASPKERIVAITRYYLSAFHSARRSTIAKKPYNPILGEIFRCYWDLPNGKRTPPTDSAKRTLETGPVPFASYDSVTFLAEQISHHPPISGIYAECPTKRMYVQGSVWTKSKFLGLSLGVHFVGYSKLHLMDLDEIYTITLPNAYGRSILTVPWMEMGGKCVISCEKTGFRSTVDFHCKPFYGGKKHRVTAEVCHVSERKPFLKVEGEWNGVMYTKHSNGDEEVFLDTLNTPVVRKKLKKLSAQDPEESRRRWYAVTQALLNNDVDKATEAKHALEEQQRADARERQRTGTEWVQKHFVPFEDTWHYKKPLPDRLADLESH